MKVAASILSADFSNLGKEIEKLNKTNVDYIHLDIMDGLFVPNISFGPVIVKSIRDKTNKIFDVHLMIQNPIKYIESFYHAGADIITFHVEAVSDIESVINEIKKYNIKIGLAISPDTSELRIEKFLNQADQIIVMSVSPGFSGQIFIESVVSKIKNIRKSNKNIDIMVDGGINNINAEICKKAGANIVAAASYIFKNNDDYNDKINILKCV